MKDYEIGVRPDLSKKEFENVLEKILSNPSKPAHSIPELEFEFDLKWEDLKKLLDEHCEYKRDGDKIVIIGQKPEEGPVDEIDEVSDQEYQEKFTVLQKFFYSRKRYGKLAYGRRTIRYQDVNKMDKQLLDALDYGYKRGLVIMVDNSHKKTVTCALHHYFRPNPEKRK